MRLLHSPVRLGILCFSYLLVWWLLRKFVTVRVPRQLIFLVIIGALLDFPWYSLGLHGVPGFVISAPLFFTAMVSAVCRFGIVKCARIVVLSMATMTGCMIITYGLFEARASYISDMFGVVYYLGLIPALIVGAVLGFNVAAKVAQQSKGRLGGRS